MEGYANLSTEDLITAMKEYMRDKNPENTDVALISAACIRLATLYAKMNTDSKYDEVHG